MSEVLSKFGIIGDVHANDAELKKFVYFLVSKKFRHILCTGDIVDGDGDVNECFEQLKEMSVFWVRGNHEKWLIKGEMRDFPDSTNWSDIKLEFQEVIKTTPLTIEISTIYGLLLLCHGLGENDMASLKPGDFGYGLESNEPLQKLIKKRKFKLVVSGHSHQRMIRSIDGIVFLNPGSLLPPNQEFFSVELDKRQVTIYKSESDGIKLIEKHEI
jgi:putative phosphoesterase